MYHSASSLEISRSGIFLEVSRTSASGSWTNYGLVVGSFHNSNYNAVDPKILNLYVASDGKWWLSFGSFWVGSELIELSPSTSKPINQNSLVSIAALSSNAGAIEAPVIVKHGNYFYLWVAFDNCSKGTASTCRNMVGRSSNTTGL